RRVLLTTTAVQTALAGTLTLLAATDSAHPGVVVLIVLGAGCAMAIGFPSYMALLPDLVPRDDLPGAVALSSAQWNLGRVIGPALAGVVIGFGGFEWAFGINTLSFLAVIAVVLSLRLPPPAPLQEASIFASIRAGARFARADPGLRVVISYMALNSLLAATLCPLGSVPQRAIAGGVGLRPTTAGAAVLMAAALLLVRMPRPDLTRALDEPTESGTAERTPGDGDEPDRARHLAVPPGPEGVVAADGTGDHHRDEQSRGAERSH